MKQCFGAENVNDDQDEEFKSCKAEADYAGEDGTHMDNLPGGNNAETAAHGHARRYSKAEDDYNYGTATPGSSVVPTSASSVASSLVTTLGPLFTDATTIPASLRPTTPLNPLSISSSVKTPVSSSKTADECKPAVTVTVTPTVTVTAGLSTCKVGTVYETVTNTATVTISQDNYGNAYNEHVEARAHRRGPHRF